MDYEAATLAIRTASLWAAYGQIAATLLIGIGQIAIVWFGIRAMQRAGAARAKEQDQRHTEAMDQHAEAMTALRELIDGQRDDRAALAALIARTS